MRMCAGDSGRMTATTMPQESPRWLRWKRSKVFENNRVYDIEQSIGAFLQHRKHAANIWKYIRKSVNVILLFFINHLVRQSTIRVFWDDVRFFSPLRYVCAAVLAIFRITGDAFSKWNIYKTETTTKHRDWWVYFRRAISLLD